MQALLSGIRLADFLARSAPPAVVELSVRDTVATALQVLARVNILSAPCAAGPGTYCGFVDVADILRALWASLTPAPGEAAAAALSEAALLRAARALEQCTLGSLPAGCDGALVWGADADSTLWEVVVHGFLAPLAQGAPPRHRVAIFAVAEPAGDGTGPAPPSEASGSTAGADPGSSTAAVRGIRITHIVSQSDVIALLARRGDELDLSVAGATLEQLGMADKGIVCVPPEMSTLHAYHTMLAQGVTCVGVVSHDAGGALVATLAASDLRGLLPSSMGLLALPVLEFLQQRRSCQGPLGAGGGGGGSGGAAEWDLKGAEAPRPPPVLTAPPSTTLGAVVATLAEQRQHRAWVVDGHGRPRGLVTLTDVLVQLVGPAGMAQAAQAAAAEAAAAQEQAWAPPGGTSTGPQAGETAVLPATVDAL